MLLAVLFAFLAVSPVAAGEPTVSPDRPDVSNSTDTVPRGYGQLEAGLVSSRESVAGAPDQRRLAVESMVRVGLTDGLEARLQLEPFVRLRGGDGETGHGDLTFALKYRFLDADGEGRWPALALLPAVKFPIARAPIGTERPDFSLLGIASFGLPWELGLDVNAGVSVVGQADSSSYLVQALVSASLSRQVLERLSVFGEVFFTTRSEHEGRDRIGLDAGIAYLVTRRIALDAAAETTVAGAGPDWAVRGGFSVLFGR